MSSTLSSFTVVSSDWSLFLLIALVFGMFPEKFVFFLSVFGVPAMVLQRLLSDFGRPKRPRTTTTAEEGAAKLNERRASELKRLGLSGRRPPFKVGRPSLQSLKEDALFLQVRTDPDSTEHITDKTVPKGWTARHERFD